MQLGETITAKDVVASWNIALRGLEKLKLMRGSRVKWSPNSPRSGAVKNRTEPGNPEAKKYLKITTAIHK